MIGILLLSSSLLLILVIALMVLVVHIKKWKDRKDEESKEQLRGLKESIDETQRLFKNQVTNILNQFNKLLNNKNENLKP